MSPATTIHRDQDSQFAQVLEELKSAPTNPGTSTQLNSVILSDITLKDAKAAADKLARQISKAGLQSLECVISSTSRRSNLDASIPETKMF